jgi:DNA repair exonuclease SbcCD ATPase subunit
MQLDRLQMRNFKRYRNTEVKFREGITGIVGNNGTGKSTIVDAILFSLFGVKETGLEYLLSASAGPRERAVVRLDFSVMDQEYRLLRCLGPGKKHEVYLHQGSRLFAQGVSEVQHALRQVIRMGHADFRRTIFSGQKELLAMVEATPEERKRWFRKVLGIDSLKEGGGEILRGSVQAAREELLKIEGRLRGSDPAEIRKEMALVSQRISDVILEAKVLRGAEQALAATRASLQEEEKNHRSRERKDLSTRSLIRAREGEAAELERDLGKIRTALAALEVSRDEFRDLLAAETGFPALQERYAESAERERRFRELASKDAEKKERLADVEEELARLGAEDACLARDEERVRDLAPLIARRREVQDRLTGFRGMEERHRTIAAGIERREATLEELAKRGEVLRSRIERMKAARSRLVALAQESGVPPGQEGEPIPFFEARLKELQQAIADGKAGRDQAARRLSDLEADLSTLAAEGEGGSCPTCRQPLGERYTDLMASIRRDLEELRKARASQESRLRQAEEDLGVLQNILDQARELRDACRNQEEDSAEWESVQDDALRGISARDHLRQEMAALGYDTRVRDDLEREFASLEDPWKESLAAAERLKGRPEIRRKVAEAAGNAEKVRKDILETARERDGLGFDPGIHRRIEEDYRTAEQAHRRYHELKPRMEQLPVLLEQERNLKARAASVEQNLGGLRAELSAIAFLPEALRQVEDQLEENSRQLLELGRRLERALAEETTLEAERIRLDEAHRRLEEDMRDRDRLGEEIGLLELTREELNGFTDHLLGVVRDRVQEETGRILSEITDGRYDTVLIDDDFELLVHDLGGDFPVSRFSGGEQDDVAIALRIALSRYIAMMHELHDRTFLIFDEIFGSQDEERRANIFRTLRALEPSFPQIFLISHVTEVQGEFGNTLVVEAVSPSESRIRDLEGAEA